ncbi:carboxypeptidase-like regulatory domain-containing protein [Desulfuribacillus alkaliarsenatis]|uniref:Carboxypeptidase regulatory-like domain-containing protein n=1 Tax=Desulfuribacillus alkaliarsenatis TaxID=766136 RepID=A0A1E5G2A8_9FIRM|nr:carboxypeptidase-like regulatory domain-containing protein [Desulfuribacillus alkaliarsenatis]OEF97128.1 hypothetical protein BHF68_05900 [Desulfuribacillus alkaliarsenatis]
MSINAQVQRCQVSHKASVVFYILDSYTGYPVTHASIQIADIPLRPYVNKKDGYYVFTNLESTDYTFVIEADSYMKVTRKVNVGEQAPPVLPIHLQHRSDSKLIQDTTRIELKLRDQQHKPIEVGKEILVALLSHSVCARAIEDTAADETHLPIYSNQGHALVGKQWLIHRGDNQIEVVKIIDYVSKEGRYTIEKPLASPLEIGTLLYPAWSLLTDEQGVVLLPLPKTFIQEEVELYIYIDESYQKQQVKLQPGRKSEIIITAEGE